MDKELATLLHAIKMGDLLTDTLEGANKWKIRMIKAYGKGGVVLPDNWEDLPEDEKSRRINMLVDYLENDYATNKAVSTIVEKGSTQ